MQDIWDFVALDNVGAAGQLEDEFFNTFEKLARQPRMGHVRPDLTERDVLFWPIGSYLVIYRQLQRTLEIVAILHGARDIPEVMRKRPTALD